MAGEDLWQKEGSATGWWLRSTEPPDFAGGGEKGEAWRQHIEVLSSRLGGGRGERPRHAFSLPGEQVVTR